MFYRRDDTCVMIISDDMPPGDMDTVLSSLSFQLETFNVNMYFFNLLTRIVNYK